MLKFLGVKSVYAEPMLRGPYLGAVAPNQAVSEFTFNEQGYKVVYPDGYTSWSPKEVFEKAYKLLPEGVFGLIIDYDQLDGKWVFVNAPIADPLAIKTDNANNAKLYCVECGKEAPNGNLRCSCSCGIFQPDPEHLNRGVNMADELPIIKLHAPSRYPLAECLDELCYGRTASDQNFLKGCIQALEVMNPSDTFSFGSAIEKLKNGFKVARSGWNGKGMWLKYMNGNNGELPRGAKHLLPWIGMKTADNGFVPWLASQTDMLAEDWVIAE